MASTPAFPSRSSYHFRMAIEALLHSHKSIAFPNIRSKHHPHIAANRFLASESIHLRSGIGNDTFSTPPPNLLLRAAIHCSHEPHPSPQFSTAESTVNYNATDTQAPKSNIPRTYNTSLSRSTTTTKFRLPARRRSTRYLQYPDSRLRHAAANRPSTLSLLLQHLVDARNLRRRGEDMRGLRVDSRAGRLPTALKPRGILSEHR